MVQTPSGAAKINAPLSHSAKPSGLSESILFSDFRTCLRVFLSLIFVAVLISRQIIFLMALKLEVQLTCNVIREVFFSLRSRFNRFIDTAYNMGVRAQSVYRLKASIGVEPIVSEVPHCYATQIFNVRALYKLFC